MLGLVATLGVAMLAAAPAMAQTFDPIGVPETPSVPIIPISQDFPSGRDAGALNQAAIPRAVDDGGAIIVYLAGETSSFSRAPSGLMAERFTNDNPLTFQQGYQLATVFSQIDDVGGSLSGLPAEIPPVPEPHEWAMMAAGVGVAAWAARRRQRQAI